MLRGKKTSGKMREKRQTQIGLGYIRQGSRTFEEDSSSFDGQVYEAGVGIVRSRFQETDVGVECVTVKHCPET